MNPLEQRLMSKATASINGKNRDHILVRLGQHYKEVDIIQEPDQDASDLEYIRQQAEAVKKEVIVEYLREATDLFGENVVAAVLAYKAPQPGISSSDRKILEIIHNPESWEKPKQLTAVAQEILAFQTCF
jgi:hypothetical protein